jgi:hypothetical protein
MLDLRTILGFLLAPLMVPLLYLAAAAAFGGFLSFDLAVLAGEIAYLAALLGGLPLHVALMKLGWASLHDYMVFGFLLGAASVLVSEHAPVEFTALMQAGLAALAGMIAGGVFWLIARPDRGRTARAA